MLEIGHHASFLFLLAVRLLGTSPLKIHQLLALPRSNLSSNETQNPAPMAPEPNAFSTADAMMVTDEKNGEPDLHSGSFVPSLRLEALDEDPALDRLILWKRDLLLVPMLGLLYLVMFLDRTNIANARIEGLEAGLDMPSNGYNNCLWIFYIPFVLAEVPSNLFLNLGIIKPNWFLGGQMLLLGKA